MQLCDCICVHSGVHAHVSSSATRSVWVSDSLATMVTMVTASIMLSEAIEEAEFFSETVRHR